jgi:cell division protein FtsB
VKREDGCHLHLLFAIWHLPFGVSVLIEFRAVRRTRVVRLDAMSLVGSRFRFSLRTLMLVTAAIALLLVPVAWVARERMQMMRAQEALLQAREVALRSVVREGQRLPRQSEAMEQLRRENADLKQQVEQLRRQVEQLRSPPGRTDTVAQ